MAYVVSFSNQKGGVGKTTSCVNLAAYIALSGYKVLLVDLDSQANASSALGVFDKKAENSIYTALCTGDIRPCIVKGADFDFVPSSRNLTGAELELKDKEDREQLMPYIGEVITNYNTKKLRCQDVECYCSDLYCIECPLADHGKLNPGEFKILKPKDKKSEE